MENNSTKITLVADDISTHEFDSFLKEHFPKYNTALETTPVEKEGRGVGELLTLLISSSMAIGLFQSFLYDLIKLGFQTLLQEYGAKPIAVITLVDGTRIELPRTLSDIEIQQRILESVQAMNVKSIQFDS